MTTLFLIVLLTLAYLAGVYHGSHSGCAEAIIEDEALVAETVEDER
jgi:hypothetical protein